MSRAVAEMMPDVTVPPSPNGLPIANTQSPTRTLFESPQAAAGSGFLVSILSSARSVTGSRPTTWAFSAVLSDSVTVICCAFAMTWLFVTMSPEGSTMNPDPSEATGVPEAPGPPFSPTKSRKTSSSVLPAEFCGLPGAAPAGSGAASVEMLTTVPTTRPARSAKTSANGVFVIGLLDFAGSAAFASGGAGGDPAFAGAGAGTGTGGGAARAAAVAAAAGGGDCCCAG